MALKLLNILIVMAKKLIFLLAILLTFSLPAKGEEGNVFSKVGVNPFRDHKKAPNFCLEDLNGEKVQLNALKGKIMFLNFWATWCGPCKEEMPSMEALYQHYRERDFLFLTISIDYGGREQVRKFIETHRYHFPILIDPAGKTLDLFEIGKIPATLIIDRNGRMIGRAIGPRNWSSPEIFSLVDQMLHDRPSRVVSLKD